MYYCITVMTGKKPNEQRSTLIKDSSGRKDAVCLEVINLGVLQYFRSAMLKLSRCFQFQKP